MRIVACILGIIAVCGFGAPLAAAADTQAVEVGRLLFPVPAEWRRLAPPNPFRKAVFEIADPRGGDPAMLVFYHFGAGRGGTVEANIERWLGQFAEDRAQLGAVIEDDRQRAGRTVFFQAAGTFLSGAPGGPKTPRPDYGLLAGIVAGPDGNVFLRLIGPAALTGQAAAAFRRMLDGATATN